MPGNIGYVKFNMFTPGQAAQETAAAAMNFVANADALIFDLRENGGGSPEMIAFLSGYLFDRKVHLNSFYNRETDETEEWHSREDVPGRRFGETKPVYVLTSGRTFSGAEEFTYNLKNLKRATIVGETTGGGAHPVNARDIAGRFTLMVPFARAINPITKTNWEGTGVEPDTKVPAADALDAALESARNRVIRAKP
jgi:C-terminal processing protease CtpA/Prc